MRTALFRGVNGERYMLNKEESLWQGNIGIHEVTGNLGRKDCHTRSLSVEAVLRILLSEDKYDRRTTA